MDDILHLTKVLVAACSVILIYRFFQSDRQSWHGSLGALGLAVAVFMTGAEFQVPTDQPWSYLMFDATEEERVKAIIGGMFLLAAPLPLWVLVGADLTNHCVEASNESSTPDQRR